MRTITVTATKDIRRRKNGAVSYFNGTVRIDGCEIREFRVQLKSTDEGADDVRLEDGILTMPETVANRVLKGVAARQAAFDHTVAFHAAQDDERHGHILRRLVPIAAVSEAQREFAEQRRRAIVIGMSGAVGQPADQTDPERRTIVEAFWDEVASETNAKFWLDDARRGEPMEIFRDRAFAAVGGRAA